MLIKDCLELVPEKEQLKVIVFEGNKNMFFTWLEYTSKKDASYLFKIEWSYNETTKKADIHLILDSVKKDYSSIVKQVVRGIECYYEKEYGSSIHLLIKKTYRKKETLLDLLFLK